MSVSKLSQRLKRLEERCIAMTEPIEIRVSYIDPLTMEETDSYMVRVDAYPDDSPGTRRPGKSRRKSSYR